MAPERILEKKEKNLRPLTSSSLISTKEKEVKVVQFFWEVFTSGSLRKREKKPESETSKGQETTWFHEPDI